MKKYPKKYPKLEVKLSRLGQVTERGLAPESRKLIGQKLTAMEFEKELMRIGSGSRPLFYLEEKK